MGRRSRRLRRKPPRRGQSTKTRSREGSPPIRTTYAAEQRFPWLTPLLDAFAILDSGCRAELEAEGTARGVALACRNNCFACCLNPVVPVTAPEFAGISWYVSEELPSGVQDRLRERLETHAQRAECPFLLDGSCSIYLVRPIACRQFHVFRRACVPGEEPARTRAEDVFFGTRDLSRRVALRFLESPFYSFRTDEARQKAFDNGFMLAQSKPMHTLPLEKLILAMDATAATRRQNHDDDPE